MFVLLVGELYYCDSRSTSPSYTVNCHEGGIHGVSQSYSVNGLICTCGADEVYSTSFLKLVLIPVIATSRSQRSFNPIL